MNTRKDKIDLLKAIQDGEIDPKDLPSNPFICSRAEDMWVGLMMASAQYEGMGRSRVVLLGPAERKWAAFLEEIKARKDKEAQISK